MRLTVLLACFGVGLALADEAVTVPGLHSLAVTHHHTLRAEDGDSLYHIVVGLPDAYQQSADSYFPTVYILDGGMLYPMLKSYSRYLSLGGEAPEMILVAISYGSNDWRQGNQRNHDYTAPSDEADYYGGAADFQVLLRDEVIPLVQSNYRSDGARRIIFGQSLGGQFVLYTAMTDPDLFWGHIASNPALHRNLDLFLGDAGDTETSESKLYVASAENDDPVYRVPAVEWIEHWTSRASHPWRLKTETLDGHNHFSAPPASFRRGIIWLFAEND